MITSNEVSASSYGTQWQSINWKSIEQKVLKLQMRIAKATREGKQGRVKALQWILTGFLHERRLTLSEEKPHVTHINDALTFWDLTSESTKANCS